LYSPSGIPQCLVLWPFSRLFRNLQPGVSTGGSHPYGETANPRRGFQLQSPADVPQGSVSWLWFPAFPSTHNPVIYPVAAIPPGRRPISGTGIWFPGFSLWLSPKPTTPCFSRNPPPLRGDGQSRQSFPGFPCRPLSRFWFPGICSAVFLQIRNPAKQPKTATPSGRRSTAAVLPWLSTPAISAVPALWYCFRITHNPAFFPQPATPPGNQPTTAKVSPKSRPAFVPANSNPGIRKSQRELRAF